MLAGILWTLGVEYAVGVILGAVNFVVQAPWRISGRERRIASRNRGWWQFTWWGVILLGIVNALLWPALLVQIVKDAL